MNDRKQELANLIAEIELPSLWRFALQITRDKHDAEDLVQRTCVRAIEQSDRYTDTGKLKSWLFRIAHNIWRNELRSRTIRERGDLMAANPDGVNETAPGRDIVTPETRLEFDEVVAAVEALPEGQRLVVQLVCVNGFSYSETASILEVAIGTVMSRLARARISIGEQFLIEESEGQLRNLPQNSSVTRNNSEQRL